MTQLNAEVKRKWVAALRSGEYKQGKNALCRGNEYCCLGVLAEVMGLEKTQAVDPISSGGTEVKVYKYGGLVYEVYLPRDIMDRHQQGVLGEMNDGDKSFDEIANYIETGEV